MSTSSNQFNLYILKHLMDGRAEPPRKVLIGLRGVQQPLGPGIISRVDDGGLLRITAEGNVQTTPQSRPMPVLVPVLFHVDDVVSIGEEITTTDGTPLSQVASEQPREATGGKIWTPGS